MSIQQKQCAIKGCTSNFDHLRKGYCQKHYESLKKYGDPMFITNRRNNRPKRCKVEGCNKLGYKDSKGERTRYPKGYCQTHYARLYNHGTLEVSIIRRDSESHGRSGTKQYIAWQTMIRRCYDKRHKSYTSYGARGIRVCDRWLYSFSNFLEDMGERPDGMTLDRIDPNGNYEPSNCRWATNKEQANNRTNSRLLTVDGVTKTVTEWAEYSDVTAGQIARRVKSGWSHKDAVFKPRLRARKSS